MSQLLDRMRDRIRTLHYSIRTEDADVLWDKQFILFHRMRHPLEMGEAEVGEFLIHLAVERNVAASIQNQALSAILFLYKVVPVRPLERVDDVLRAKKPNDCLLSSPATSPGGASSHGGRQGRHGEPPLSVGVAPDGVPAVARQGCRLRAEPHRRARRQGGKDRVTVLPASLVDALRRQVERVAEIHRQDLRDGFGRVYLPFALAKKYPNADREPGWQYLFPARVESR